MGTHDAAADIVVRGGSIHTFDAHDTVTDALALRDGRIVASGRAAAALSATRVIELDGRTVLPGINDAHLHAAWLGARWPHLFFGDAGPGHSPEGRLVATEADRRAALTRAWRLLASLGITSYTEPGIGPGEDDGETGCFGQAMLDTYVTLHRAGAQTARVTLLRLFGHLDGEAELEDVRRGVASPVPATDPCWLNIAGVKIFADGIPPMRSAWVREPYLDGTTGALLTRGSDPVEAFRGMIAAALDAGCQIAVHATGDRSIDEFVSALESHGPAASGIPGGHYVVHADLVDAELLARMAQAGVGIAAQPVIADHTGAWMEPVLGASRTAAAWPLRRMIDTGVRTTITSDAPIATPDWRVTIDAALRMLGEDTPQVRRDLLHRVTTVPAAQDAAAQWKGTLTPGMAADLVVLDEDPTRPGRPVAGIGVAGTVVGGRVVFERGETPESE
ncbi:hypothetical protein LK09_18900 [Microbacterium mangrovi]|uniref:Amidohydrolase 3 domain-containing protein n=1 Tax=Microbacterium mangrovi TaxID=1348253 RepID=A0A0B2A0Y0_9MICO|nr:amidohydrolase family protein [Microbacterium mangrovi]KHK95467.1 hypothetical protein LK09_18900 [Microbacterium mangrovi]